MKTNMIKNKVNLFFTITFIAFLFYSCKQSNEQTDVKEPTNFGKIKLKGCGFNSFNEYEIPLLPPELRVVQIIDNIVKFSGLPNNFLIYRSDYINNAYASIVNGERIIVYDPKLFLDIELYSETYWTSVSILAHEIGHHLSGHTGDNIGSVPYKELEADKFSGFILYKMGATLEQSLKAMKLIASDYESDTHPAKQRRLRSIIEGWNEANNQRFKSALPPSPVDSPEDYYVFTKEMLIDNDLIYNSNYNDWFRDNGLLYGVVLENNKDSFVIRILKTSKDFEKDFRSLNNEDWTIHIESPNYFGSNTKMCHVCAENLQFLLQPGRRLSFSMVESLPDHGTSLNGVWFLIYAKALSSNYFDN